MIQTKCCYIDDVVCCDELLVVALILCTSRITAASGFGVSVNYGLSFIRRYCSYHNVAFSVCCDKLDCWRTQQNIKLLDLFKMCRN